MISRYKYVHYEDFIGSIKGVNRFLKPGDILKDDDIPYFQQNYPDRIIDISQPKIKDEEILNLIKNQSEKIDLLMNIVSTQQPKTVYIKDNNVKINPISDDTISLKEDSIAKHVKIDSNIESQGSVGETKSEGDSVSNKIQMLKKKLGNKS